MLVYDGEVGKMEQETLVGASLALDRIEGSMDDLKTLIILGEDGGYMLTDLG